MSIRLGINPIGWTNDCMGWLGDFISLDTCLKEAKKAGFAGVELGRKFLRVSLGGVQAALPTYLDHLVVDVEPPCAHALLAQ